MSCGHSDEACLVTGISALAALLASVLSDEELEAAAASLTQLADTLATIAVRRSLQESGE
jgi:hypothetical protein